MAVKDKMKVLICQYNIILSPKPNLIKPRIKKENIITSKIIISRVKIGLFIKLSNFISFLFLFFKCSVRKIPLNNNNNKNLFRYLKKIILFLL